MSENLICLLCDADTDVSFQLSMGCKIFQCKKCHEYKITSSAEKRLLKFPDRKERLSTSAQANKTGKILIIRLALQEEKVNDPQLDMVAVFDTPHK